MYTGFWWCNLREREFSEGPGVGGRIIFRWIFRKWDVGRIDWIKLTPDRGRWRAHVNGATNLRVP